MDVDESGNEDKELQQRKPLLFKSLSSLCQNDEESGPKAISEREDEKLQSHGSIHGRLNELPWENAF